MNLSDLRKSPDIGRPEREHRICVAGRLVRELEPVDAELWQLQAQIEELRAQRDDEGQGPRKRAGEKSPLAVLEEKAADLAAKADEIRDRMEQHTITLLLRGKSNSEWRRWVYAHPARDKDTDPTGAERDAKWASGFCNIDALIADLGGYIENGTTQPGFVAKYGDEDPAEDSWALVSENAAPGDLTYLASVVVSMHEQVVDPGKSRVAWLDARRSVNS